MTGANCDLFTHNQSRSYLNHLVYYSHASGQLSIAERLLALQPRTLVQSHAEAEVNPGER